jgi:hypothetical protein
MTRIRNAIGICAAAVSVALLAAFVVQPSQDSRLAAVRRAAESISATDIVRDVNVIASDANRGRATPSPGYDSAAAYIARELRRLGVRPMGDNGTYFQYYTVTRSLLDTISAAASIGSTQLKWGDDFIVQNFLVPGVREGSVVYVGHGLRAPKLGIDAYEGVDIKGKWVLAHSTMLGQALPPGTNVADLGRLGADYTTVREEAKLRGAAGVLLVPNAGLMTTWNRRATTGRDLNPSVGWAYAQYQVPRVALSRSAFERLLAGSSLSAAAVTAAESTRVYPRTTELGADRRVRVNFAATTSDDRPYNVVGMIDGSDPQLRDEWISIAAHLDGAVGRGVRDGDSIYNAADDNGSGSAGNMAIARALMSAPRARRPILLIWDSGEEVGLWGTRHIAYGALGEKIVAHVSNDMIGRSRVPGTNSPQESNLAGPGEVHVTGPMVLSTNMESMLQRSLTQFPFVRALREYEDVAAQFFYPRTDAGPYMERGIPIVQFFTGLHADYHQQGDEPAKLDPAKMEAVSRQSFVTLWLMADSPEKPKWDKPVPYTLWMATPR